MEVKKIDIFESVLIAILLYIFISNSFSNLGVVLSLVLALGITTIFLIFYHERYIGVVLNIITSLLWTVLITSFLSIFSLFHNNTWLLVIIGLGLLYLFLRLHGLDIVDFIKNIKSFKPVKVSSVQDSIDEYKIQYETYLKYKEKLMPVFSDILSDPNAPTHIKATTSDYIVQMNAIEKENKAFLRISKRKTFFANTQEYILNCTNKLRQLNIEFKEHINILDERERKEQEKRYRQSQQYNQSMKESVSSYFNGCNSLNSLKERYRDLCKIYHPDSGNGSQQEFVKIQEEFEILKKKYS